LIRSLSFDLSIDFDVVSSFIIKGDKEDASHKN